MLSTASRDLCAALAARPRQRRGRVPRPGLRGVGIDALAASGFVRQLSVPRDGEAIGLRAGHLAGIQDHVLFGGGFPCHKLLHLPLRKRLTCAGAIEYREATWRSEGGEKKVEAAPPAGCWPRCHAGGAEK
jgi:hypothetical protein